MKLIILDETNLRDRSGAIIHKKAVVTVIELPKNLLKEIEKVANFLREVENGRG